MPIVALTKVVGRKGYFENAGRLERESNGLINAQVDSRVLLNEGCSGVCTWAKQERMRRNRK